MMLRLDTIMFRFEEQIALFTVLDFEYWWDMDTPKIALHLPAIRH